MAVRYLRADVEHVAVRKGLTIHEIELQSLVCAELMWIHALVTESACARSYHSS